MAYQFCCDVCGVTAPGTVVQDKLPAGWGTVLTAYVRADACPDCFPKLVVITASDKNPPYGIQFPQ